MAKAPNKSPKNEGKEEKCIHDYEEHLKRLQGGDYMKPAFKNNDRFPLRYPSRRELAAFFDIGAEAERRTEAHLKDMKSCMEETSKENDRLRRENISMTEAVNGLQVKIAENENVILSLTTENDELNCQLTQNRDLNTLKAQYECERGQILEENNALSYQLKQIKSTYLKLKEEHSDCPKSEELEAKECKILRLADSLNDKEIQLERNTCELKALKEKESMLETKITSLEDQIQSQYDLFTEKSFVYQKAIDDLKSQVSFLERSLGREITCPKFDQICQEIINEPMTLQETHNVDHISERDRILQELIAKIELKDRNLQQLTVLQNSRYATSEKEYSQLCKLIKEQGCEIDRLTNDLQKWSIDDNNSKELLNEVWNLQKEVSDKTCYDPKGNEALERRIKRLKCKIKSRLQREEARRKELSRQLGIYRCQFVTLQKEIEELRQENLPTAKDEIKLRVDKEKALSQVICYVNKQKRELNTKCESLSKAVINIETVIDFLMNLS